MRELLKEQREKIRSYYKRVYKRPEFQQEKELRHKRTALVDFLRTPEKIDQMTELDVGRMISNLWAYNAWTNKDYVVEHIINDNTLARLKEYFKRLLYDNEPFERRFDEFNRHIKHLGPASATEILCLYDPKQFGIWNDRARKALK
ncbi:MAG: hypothetical protein DRP30_06310, partial [Thermotoga sp.]